MEDIAHCATCLNSLMPVGKAEAIIIFFCSHIYHQKCMRNAAQDKQQDSAPLPQSNAPRATGMKFLLGKVIFDGVVCPEWVVVFFCWWFTFFSFSKRSEYFGWRRREAMVQYLSQCSAIQRCCHQTFQCAKCKLKPPSHEPLQQNLTITCRFFYLIRFIVILQRPFLLCLPWEASFFLVPLSLVFCSPETMRLTRTTLRSFLAFLLLLSLSASVQGQSIDELLPASVRSQGLKNPCWETANGPVCTPKAFIYGMPFSGGDVLYSYLKQHPSVVPSPNICPFPKTNVSDFLANFPSSVPTDSIMLNNCTDGSTQSLIETTSDAKVILILRSKPTWLYNSFFYWCTPKFDVGCTETKLATPKMYRTPGLFHEFVKAGKALNTVMTQWLGSPTLFQDRLANLTQLGENRLLVISYEALVNNTQNTLAKVTSFLELSSHQYESNTEIEDLIGQLNPNHPALLPKTIEPLSKLWIPECVAITSKVEDLMWDCSNSTESYEAQTNSSIVTQLPVNAELDCLVNCNCECPEDWLLELYPVAMVLVLIALWRRLSRGRISLKHRTVWKHVVGKHVVGDVSNLFYTFLFCRNHQSCLCSSLVLRSLVAGVKSTFPTSADVGVIDVVAKVDELWLTFSLVMDNMGTVSLPGQQYKNG